MQTAIADGQTDRRTDEWTADRQKHKQTGRQTKRRTDKFSGSSNSNLIDPWMQGSMSSGLLNPSIGEFKMVESKRC